MQKYIYFSLLYLLPVSVLADGIYLKGNEGEKFLSADDVSCVNLAETKHSLTVSFRLKPEQTARAAKFSRENRGVRATLVACGTPLALPLGSVLEGKDTVMVRVPPELRKCVKEKSAGKPPCGNAKD